MSPHQGACFRRVAYAYAYADADAAAIAAIAWVEARAPDKTGVAESRAISFDLSLGHNAAARSSGL